MNVRSLLAAALLLTASSAAVAGEKPVTDQEIKHTVESHMSDLKACLGPDNGVAGGKLRVSIAIEPDGHVSKTEINKASENHKIDACIAKAIGKMTFPKPRNKQMWLSSYPITFTAPKVAKVGTLTEEQIVATMKTLQDSGEITSCYTAAAKDKAGLAGELDLGIAVSATGAVVEVETLSSGTGSSRLDTCVIGKVKAAKFPAPTGGGEASFKYPMAFGAPEAAKKDDKK